MDGDGAVLFKNLGETVLGIGRPGSFLVEEPWQGHESPPDRPVTVTFPPFGYRDSHYDFDADMETTKKRWLRELAAMGLDECG